MPWPVRLARRRRVSDRIVAALCIAATAIGLLLLASILFTLVSRGIAGLSLGVLYKNTAPSRVQRWAGQRDRRHRPANPGGHRDRHPNRVDGRHLPVRIRRRIRPSATAVRFVSDVLLSAPSILIGLFIYLLIVLPSGGFSGHRRVRGAGRDRDPHRRPHDGGHAAPHSHFAPGSRSGARCAEMESNRVHLLPGGRGRHHDRCAARDRPHRG